MTTIRPLPYVAPSAATIAAGSAPAGAWYTLLTAVPAAWSNGTAYVVGDLVKVFGRDFVCTVAHTAATATDKPITGSAWYAKWMEESISSADRLPGFVFVRCKNLLSGTGSTVELSLDGGLHAHEIMDAGDIFSRDIGSWGGSSGAASYGAVCIRGLSADPSAGSFYASGFVRVP